VTHGLPGKDPASGSEIQLETAFKAIIKGKSSGPVICIMLEYDALPMGHACGHNLIAISGLAAAASLAPHMDKIKGELWVIGTPAEEGGKFGGKIPLLKAGHFDDSDIVLITHPGDRWDTGADFLAISGGRFTFSGIPAHAAADPQRGISALDAAILAYTNIEMMREHIRPDARIHGIIKEGGTAVNVIPDRAVLSYAVRALDQIYVESLKKKIEHCVRSGAEAVGANVHIAWSYGYSAPINVSTLDSLVLSTAQEEGIEGIKEWEALGSSDLGNVGYEIPTCNLWFKIAPEGILPHTHEFMKAAGGAEGFQSALNAGIILAISAYTLYEHPKLVCSIAGDFKKLKNTLAKKN
jgi:amidohydrolase